MALIFFEGERNKPLNSFIVINDKGEIEILYDKRLLSEFRLDWYIAGTEPGIFETNRMQCGLLICHNWRYSKLYRVFWWEPAAPGRGFSTGTFFDKEGNVMPVINIFDKYTRK